MFLLCSNHRPAERFEQAPSSPPRRPERRAAQGSPGPAGLAEGERPQRRRVEREVRGDPGRLRPPQRRAERRALEARQVGGAQRQASRRRRARSRPRAAAAAPRPGSRPGSAPRRAPPRRRTGRPPPPAPSPEASAAAVAASARASARASRRRPGQSGPQPIATSRLRQDGGCPPAASIRVSAASGSAVAVGSTRASTPLAAIAVDRRRRVGRPEQLDHLRPDPLARQPPEAVDRRGAGREPRGVEAGRRIAVPGVEPEKPKHAQIVLGDPRRRRADEPDPPRPQVGQARRAGRAPRRPAGRRAHSW